MNHKRIILITIPVLVLGLALGAVLILRQTITIQIDGKSRQVTTWALTAGSVLSAAGVHLSPADNLTPPIDAWITFNHKITLERAVQVSITADGKTTTLLSSDHLPARLLAQAGVKLLPGDLLLLNGKPANPDESLSPAQTYTFQVRRSVDIILAEDGKARTIATTAVTVGQALWQAGVRLEPDDTLIPEPETLITEPVTITLRRAVPLTISMQDQVIHVRTSAVTVGAALAQVGLGLQGLDYSLPAEDQPLPVDGRIRVVQVRDEILLEQTTIPFETKTAPDPNTELDQHSVVQPGQEGIIVTRTRLRYEDGQEINRQVEGEWQARPPQDRIVGFGTKVVIKTAVVDGVAIEYWRSITVFATSYSPCNSDASRCYPNTATGLPVTKGVAGVKRAWFGYLVGQNVFVPGYGVAQIADIGGGYPDGRAHIDLGYSDADYVPWYWWVTIYFLTPVPENILWIMQ